MDAVGQVGDAELGDGRGDLVRRGGRRQREVGDLDG
jgi:hypothetical protein